MKQMTKQLIMAAIVLSSVTVLSFGIRRVRLSVHRARNAKGPVSNGAASQQYSAYEPVGSARNTQPHDRLDVPLEQNQQPADPMTDSQEAFAEAHDGGGREQADDQFDAYEHSGKRADIVSIDKSFKADYSKFKGDYAKSKGSKGLQKISVGAYENLYITDKGEHWYVTQHPDGTTTKMQLQEIDGQLQPAGEANVYPSQGGKGKSEDAQAK